MQVYVSHEREAKLRSYSKSKGVTISSLLADFIDNLDHQFVPAEESLDDEFYSKGEAELMPMCQQNFCKQRSIGKYKIITDGGENEITKDLCTFHWNQARKEGEVHAA